MEPDIYYIDNDNMILLEGLTDAANGSFMNGASASVTIVDAATEEEIAGQTWPATMDYVSGSDGNYRATLEYDLDVSEGQTLMAFVIVDSGPGLRLSLRKPVLAIYRQGN